MSLSDHDFQVQFEACTLSPEHFSHLGHMRIAWLYLNQQPLEEAIVLTCRNIKRYAESLGGYDKFNYTITAALVKLMYQRKQNMKIPSWEGFLAENPDLVADALGVLHQYYSPESLVSVTAQTRFIAPDRQSL